MPTPTSIVAAACNAIFGKPLVTNVYRSVLVEAMVDAALADWTWCSQDYAAYDFLHPTGLRLEVKQSALKQTWKMADNTQPRWDIEARKGYWENGITWVDAPGRNADIYVFGLHPVMDDTADHRDPNQWIFHVVAASALPATKTIGRSGLDRLAQPVPLMSLPAAVNACVGMLRN